MIRPTGINSQTESELHSNNAQMPTSDDIPSEVERIKHFFHNLDSNQRIGSFDHNDVRRFGRNAGLTELQLDQESHDYSMSRKRTPSDFFYHVICKLHSVKGNQFNLGFVQDHLRQCQLNLISEVLGNCMNANFLIE